VLFFILGSFRIGFFSNLVMFVLPLHLLIVLGIFDLVISVLLSEVMFVLPLHLLIALGIFHLVILVLLSNQEFFFFFERQNLFITKSLHKTNRDRQT